MKNLIITLCLIAALAKAQPCASPLLVSISVANRPGYSANSGTISLCDTMKIQMVVEPSNSYTWSTGSNLQQVYYGIPSVPNTMTLSAGVNTINVAGTKTENGNPCISSANFTINVCMGNPNGISEYFTTSDHVKYVDIFGRPTEFKPGIILADPVSKKKIFVFER